MFTAFHNCAKSRIFALALLLPILVGCQDAPQATGPNPNDSNLRYVAALYARYQNANQGRPPASEEQFKAFVQEKGNKVLRLAEIDSVDSLLMSQRDGQPYVVLYGDAAEKHRGTGLVAYERQGVDGSRYVGYRLGYVEEVAENRFQKLVPEAVQ